MSDVKGAKNPKYGPLDSRAEVEAFFREVIGSEEGRERLRREILEGSSRVFWKAVDLAYGKPTQTVETEEPTTAEPMRMPVEELGEGAEAFFIAMVQRQAEEERKRGFSRDRVPSGEPTGDQLTGRADPPDTGL